MAFSPAWKAPQFQAWASGSVVGIAVHLSLFIHGEWHIHAPLIVKSHLIVVVTAFAGALYFADWPPFGDLFSFLVIASMAYMVGLPLSILTYRVAPGLHRLTRAKFPGPWLLRTSKLWHVWACRDSMNHFFLDDLHRRYGDFVRTGPSEITVFHPDVFAATDGPETECVKAEWYDLLHPDRALLTTRDRVVHDARRRDWKQGFINRALVSHAEKSLAHASILEEAIQTSAAPGQPLAMRDLFYWYGFDLMGDFVMNKPFGMLREKRWQHMVVRLQYALSVLGPASPAPWLVQLAFRLGPKIYQVRSWDLMAQWSWNEINARLAAGFEKQPAPDLIHYLLEETNRAGDMQSLHTMRGDTLQAIVAGSEPIPIVLLGIFSELVQAPEHQELIHQELVDHGYRSVDVENYASLGRLKHLNAVIHEALRLYPVLLTGGPRKTGPNGVTIADTFIPPETTIVCPRYTIQRRPDNFVEPHKFIPERWTTRRKELLTNTNAYSPWGTGHHSCVARPMAQDTLRIVTAKLLLKYRFSCGPDETGRRVFEDMKDQLAPNPGHLSLVFKLRSASA